MVTVYSQFPIHLFAEAVEASLWGKVLEKHILEKGENKRVVHVWQVK